MFLVHARKPSRKAHILDENGRTFCQIENMPLQQWVKVEKLAGQQVCMNCESLQDMRGEPDLKVLMGEAMT